MAGFDNDVVYANNVDFTGSTTVSGQVTTDAQILLGSTNTPNIRVGTLASDDATITFTYSQPTSTTAKLNLRAGAAVPTSVTTDSGIATPSSNNLNLFGGTNGIDTTASGSTVTINFDVTEQPTIPTSVGTDSGTATPSTNTFNIIGGTGIDTSGATNNVTITFDATEVPTLATTYNADSGSAQPAANIITIAGGPGITTSASGSTVTINSVVFTDQGGSTSVTSDSGSFATAAITLTLPVAPAQGEVVEFVCTSASALVVDAPSTHLIRIGTLITSAGGTATSTSIGDSLTLRYRSTGTTWYATSVIGTWVLA